MTFHQVFRVEIIYKSQAPLSKGQPAATYMSTTSACQVVVHQVFSRAVDLWFRPSFEGPGCSKTCRLECLLHSVAGQLLLLLLLYHYHLLSSSKVRRSNSWGEQQRINGHKLALIVGYMLYSRLLHYVVGEVRKICRFFPICIYRKKYILVLGMVHLYR